MMDDGRWRRERECREGASVPTAQLTRGGSGCRTENRQQGATASDLSGLTERERERLYW